MQPEPRTIWEAVVAMSRNYNYAKMPLLAKDLVATPITAYPKRDLAYTYQVGLPHLFCLPTYLPTTHQPIISSACPSSCSRRA